ncbi:MAG: hypothetical protein KC457_35620, partial [Myxococcales bacterium]|nr:hypothetical protein [Myxococcales bacterium]
MDENYYVVSIAIRRYADTHLLEISHSDPSSEAQVAPVRGETRFDVQELLGLQAAHEHYGRALTRQLFRDEGIKRRFLQTEVAARASGALLRLSLCVDASAQELHGLRWELLRHPETGALLATSETLLLSRFMISHDWRPVKLRARTELKALVVISAPPAEALEKLGLAAV